jgi:predicted dehydrogenase
MSMRAVVVGAGGMGRAWARTVNSFPGVDLVGWVDTNADVAAAAAEELQASEVATDSDLLRVLADTRPDFVIDVTVPEAHQAVTVAALKAGYPVLGEKPMASSMEEARAMVAASEGSGKLYMVSQSRRYDPGILAYRTLIEGQIGRLGILNSDFYLGAHFGEFRDKMPSPLVLDMAIHTFDAARYISRADPVAVYCEEFNPTWSWFEGSASATAIFEMDYGLRYTYRGSWCAEGRPTTWEAEWRAVGEFGTAVWDGAQTVAGDLVSGNQGFTRESTPIKPVIEPMANPGIQGSLTEFVEALRTGKTPMGECHDNIKSLGMVFGAIKSSRLGKRVPIHI